MLGNEKKKLIESEEKYRHEISQKIRSEAEALEQGIDKLEKKF
jgi:hypothetical protein